MNIAFVLPKSGVSVRRRLGAETVLIEGKMFTKDFGIRFAPLRHNWTYSMTPNERPDAL